MLYERRANIVGLGILSVLLHLLHGGGAGESHSLSLGKGAFLQFSLLEAGKSQVAEAEQDGGGKNDGDDDAARVETVVGLHADVLVIPIDGADVAAQAVAGGDGNALAVHGFDLVADGLHLTGHGGCDAEPEAVVAELVVVEWGGRGSGRGRGRRRA